MRVRLEGLLEGAGERVRQERRGWVQELAGRVVTMVAGLTPVRTGRLRRGWFGGGSAVPSAGEEGGEPGIANGASEGDEAVMRSDEGGSMSAVEVENSVPYAAYVEYGTRRMAARAMVRRALREFESQ